MVVPGSGRKPVKHRLMTLESLEEEEDELFGDVDVSDLNIPTTPVIKRSKEDPEKVQQEKIEVKMSPPPKRKSKTPTVVFKIPNSLTEIAKQLQTTSDEYGKLSTPPSEECLLQILKELYGFDSFRDGQLETITRILCGHDCLSILPTGTGKTLCYVIPAYIRKLARPENPSFAVVISPLVSLMSDQLKHLPSGISGVQMSAAVGLDGVNRSVTKIESGASQLLLVSPERASDSKHFHKFIKRMSCFVSLICVDEAHCLSEWSHNFRPSYLRLRTSFLSNNEIESPILCLTGTSPISTTKEVIKALTLQSDCIIRRIKPRRNLLLSAVCIEDCADRRDTDTVWLRTVATTLSSPPFNSGSVIIYVNTQTQAELVSEDLIKAGVDAICYHAGCSERMTRQNKFMRGEVRVIVATVAFGMGIDKSNVRGVIHLRLPPTLESYIQEIGRAGRDGQISYCKTILRRTDYFSTRNSCYKSSISDKSLSLVLKSILQPSQSSVQSFTTNRHTIVKYGQLSKAIMCEPEIIDTITTLLGLHYPEMITQTGNTPSISDVTVDEDVMSKYLSEAQETLTLLGDSWVRGDPVVEYIRGLFRKQCSSPIIKRRNICRVSIDIVTASATLSIEPKLLVDRLEDLKRRKWRITMRDIGMACTLKGPIQTDEEVGQISKNIFELLKRMRDMEINKIDSCYSFLKNLSQNGVVSEEVSNDAHDDLDLYTTEDSNCDGSLFQKLLSAPKPLPATPRSHPHSAISDAVFRDPVALNDPIFITKLCLGIFNFQDALHGHPLWDQFSDHSFDFLFQQSEDAIEQCK